VLHIAALSDSPTGPFVKQPDPVFVKEGVPFAAEDPFVWISHKSYWAIVKDMSGYFTGHGRSLMLFQSADGLSWDLAEYPVVATLEVTWESGQRQTMEALERPQIWLDNGEPTILFCAAAPGQGEPVFNLHFPLKSSLQVE
jgi:hypothetical protein